MPSPSPGDALARPAADGAALGAWDDMPVLRDAELLGAIAPAQAGWAERFYFNVLRPTGEIAAIVGAGVYPVRGVCEAYCCRMDGDVQRNVRSLHRLPRDGRPATGGAVTLTVDAPMRDWSVAVDAPDLRLAGRFAGIGEPYLYALVDVPPDEPGGPFDRFRHFIATGRWTIDEGPPDLLGQPGLLGVRDRTWGVRTRRVRWHNWYVFQLGGTCLTLMHQELADGTVRFSEAGIVHGDGRAERLDLEDIDVRFDRVTRDLRAGTVWLRCAAGPLQVAFERVGPGIRLAGAGYDDRQDERDEGHGVQHDAYDLADPDVAVRTGKGTIDGGAVVICRGALEATGIGVVESAIARDHVRFGEQVR